MRGRDISLRPAPLDEFFSVVMAGQYFFFQIFLWGARYNIRLLSTWHTEFLFLYNLPLMAAPFKILLAKQHRRFLFYL
ncbi:MAG TPA: hypothetical protein [Caudoviricetes sp.]|nr:MAG TPA: hypothetical protein [Caudoviricetes sp.]